MAILRNVNWLSQMRADLPHLRSIESGVAGDFDTIIGRAMAGGQPYVLRGLTLPNIGAIPAATLQLSTADAIVYNLQATESGSFLWVPDDRDVETLNPNTNSKVDGSWVPSQTNYVGIDFVRTADSETSDLVKFLDPDTSLETERLVPLARTLDYTIVISTTPFSATSNIIPIAKVTLNASSVVSTCEDARPLLFRLGSGGDSPDSQSSYAWSDGREEFTTLGSEMFTGGDKVIGDQKAWMDATMTRLWELGGGENWYSATSDRNCTQVNTGTPFANGEYFDWDGTDLLWKDLTILFDNSTAYYNTVSGQAAPSVGLTDLADGECIYVEVDRANNAAALTAQKSDLATLGAGTPPGSVWVLAWRRDTEVFTRGSKYGVGNWISVATASSTGIVKLSRAASTPSSPIVIADTGGTITGPSGSTQALLVYGYDGGATGRNAITAQGGDVTSGANTAGIGFISEGGANTGTGAGADGTMSTGGASASAAAGGHGIKGFGGTSASGNGGYGGYFAGAGNGHGAYGVGGATGQGIYGVASARTTYGLYGVGAAGGAAAFPSTPTVGGAAAYGIGGAGGASTGGTGAIGGLGSYGAGGAGGSGDTGGAGGAGLTGLGGAGGAGGTFFDGAGGPGLVGTGGTSGDGTGGHGVVGTGGNSTSGTDGYGGLFTAGGSQAIGCAVPATNDFGYTSAKTLYKWILAPNMDGNPTFCSFVNLSVPNPSYFGNLAGQSVTVDAKVDIPAGAIITDIDVCVSNISGGAKNIVVTLHKISETAYLSYDNFVGTPFVVDGTATLTGGTSGATAKIWADSGTVLTLADVTGTFQNNEVIASGGGAGDADGTVSAGPLRAFNVWESASTSVADATDRVITSVATGLTGSLPQTNPDQDALLYGQCFSVSVSTDTHGTADKIKIYGIRIAYTMQKLRQSA